MKRTTMHGVAAGMLILVLGVGGGAAFAAPQDTKPDRIDFTDSSVEDQAREHQDAGRWLEAAQAWSRAVELDPEDGTAWFNLGYCLHAAGRLEEAIEVHHKAASFDEYRGIAMYNLGCAYALAGHPDEALEALAGSQAAGFSLREQVPGDSDLESLRGDPRLAQLLEREPAGMRGMGQVQAMARQAMDRAKGFVAEHMPQAQEQIAAMIEMAARHLQQLAAQLHEMIENDERFAMLAQVLEEWLAGAGGGHEMPGASEPLHEHADDQGADLDALIDQARLSQERGDWDAAARAYETVVKHAPDSAEAWFALAYSLHMGGDYDKAIDAHRKAATFDEMKGISLYNLACAYALTGRTEKALAALAAARDAGFDLLGAMPHDSDLDSLRDERAFKKLMAEIGG